MHISEGYLPWKHALGWTLVAAPFWALGLRRITASVRRDPRQRLELGAAGGFVFLLSALKLPSVAGSSSHPTGIGWGAVRLGPEEMGVVGTMVLVFQALVLAHGGITTLGANAVAMAVVGSWTAVGVFRAARWCGLAEDPSLFLAVAISDLATYATTAFQLALAFGGNHAGVGATMLRFLGIFGVTQLPLALAEGMLAVFVSRLLRSSPLSLRESVA